ncbi:MAG: hypothetical protein ACOCRX_09660 [Candidatus Woesearchaeota archaeon]
MKDIYDLSILVTTRNLDGIYNLEPFPLSDWAISGLFQDLINVHRINDKVYDILVRIIKLFKTTPDPIEIHSDFIEIIKKYEDEKRGGVRYVSKFLCE